MLSVRKRSLLAVSKLKDARSQRRFEGRGHPVFVSSDCPHVSRRLAVKRLGDFRYSSERMSAIARDLLCSSSQSSGAQNLITVEPGNAACEFHRATIELAFPKHP